jgi:hypothetical protein
MRCDGEEIPSRNAEKPSWTLAACMPMYICTYVRIGNVWMVRRILLIFGVPEFIRHRSMLSESEYSSSKITDPSNGSRNTKCSFNKMNNFVWISWRMSPQIRLGSSCPKENKAMLTGSSNAKFWFCRNYLSSSDRLYYCSVFINHALKSKNRFFSKVT